MVSTKCRLPAWPRHDRGAPIGDRPTAREEYVPALMHYIERYGIDLKFESRLVAVNGPAREATFAIRGGPDGGLQEVTRRFDLLHVCPPQTAPDFVRSSPLAMPVGSSS